MIPKPNENGWVPMNLMSRMWVNEGSNSFCGHLDHLGRNGVWGWVINSEDPSTPVQIFVLIDDTVIASFAADQRRMDIIHLESQYVGFSFKFPEVFIDNKPHVLRFQTSNGCDLKLNDRSGLNVSCWSFCFANEKAEPTQIETSDTRASVVHGCLDHVRADNVGGWAIDHASDTPLCLYMVIDDQIHEEAIICDKIRQDLKNSGLPRAQLGFLTTIPDKFHDGLDHQLEFITAHGRFVQLKNKLGHLQSRFSFNFR